MATEEQRARELLARIATPSRMAQHAAREFMGRDYVLHPWIAYVERQVLSMLQRPGREVMIISVPPQSGKTTFCGLFLPAWYLGLNPDNSVIFVAYSGDYAATWGVRVRNFIDVYGPTLFGVGLGPQQSQNNWRTTRGFGGMLSAGIDGGITGNPGHFIIIDDVVKNMQEALSVASKKMHIGEWDGAISARFQEDTKVLITATRWAEDDLSGEILARAADPEYEGIKVTEIKIKARAEPDEEELLAMSPDELLEWRDMLGRRFGEYLQGQHSAEFFREKERSVGQYTWSTLYQASPTSLVGSMFPREKWEFFDPEDRPRMIVQVRVWDLAATEGDGDWTVGLLMGKDSEENYYVLDRQRFRRSGDAVMEQVKITARQDGLGIPIRIEMERAGAGKGLISIYTRELRGFDVQGVRAEGAKVSRFLPYSNFQQAGRIFLPKDAWWLEEWIKEHKQQMADGRGPRNDDQIDTAAYGVLELYNVGVTEIVDPGEMADGLESMEDLALRLGYSLQ